MLSTNNLRPDITWFAHQGYRGEVAGVDTVSTELVGIEIGRVPQRGAD